MAFNAAEAQAEANWTSGMTGAFTTYATAMATAEADEIIALAQALASADNSRASADVSRTMSCEPVHLNRQIASHAAHRSYVQGESGRVGTRRSSEAGAHTARDIAAATATRDQAVAYAEANKTYWVAFVGLEEGANADAITQARTVAYAEADLDHAESTSAADLAWSTGMAAAERVHEVAKAGGMLTLQTSQSLIHRDGIIDCEPPRETHEVSYRTAEATLWLVEGAAADARQLAESNALADFRTADYTARATAIATIDVAMDLPWTEYQAALAVAQRDWWVSSQKANSLALSSAIIGANATYRTTIHGALIAWATQTAAADRTDQTAAANDGHTRWVARAVSEEIYATTVANARETRDNGRAANRAERQVTYYTLRRDQLVATGQGPPESWGQIAATPDPDDAPVDRVSDSAELLAGALRRVSDSLTAQSQIVARTPQRTTYVTTTADADQAYTIAESNADATRGATIATAVAGHDVTEATTLAAAIDALATFLPLPWSTNDATVLDADADYTTVVAPAARDRVIAELYADGDFVQTVAGAERTAILNLALALAARDASLATANLERVQDEQVAQIGGVSSSMPIAYMGAVAAQGEATVPTAVPGTPPAPPPGNPPAGGDGQAPKAKTFEEIWQKVQKKWGGNKEAILREFLAGVEEGFWDGVEDTSELLWSAAKGYAKADEYFRYTFTFGGILERQFRIRLGWGDPLADENAAIEEFGNRLSQFAAEATAQGTDLYENRGYYRMLFAGEVVSVYSRVRVLREQAAQFLNANGDELIDAILTGDQEKLARLKAGLPPELQNAIDMIYAAAVKLVDTAAEQLDPHKVGYLVGQLLYEACEDAVITAAWSAVTGVTFGAGGTAAPGIVAIRVANISRKLEKYKERFGLSPQLMTKLIDHVQDAIWWAMKSIEMCFVAGTPVHTANGLKPIEQIRPGDLVYSRPDNAPTAVPRFKRVLRTVVTQPDRLYHISCEAADHREETLSGTGEHPFFVVGQGRFVAAKELTLGDEFVLADGSSAWVTRIDIEQAKDGGHFTTYNFEVEQDHTYHVGELGVWVHNSGDTLCKLLAEKLARHADDLTDDDLHKLIKKELQEIYKEMAEAAKKKGIKISKPELAKHEADIFNRLRNPGVDTRRLAARDGLEDGSLGVMSMNSRLVRAASDAQHHLLTDWRKDWFWDVYKLNVDDYVVDVDDLTHQALHAGRLALGRKAGWWDDELMRSINYVEQVNGRTLTGDEVLAIMEGMRRRFGLGPVHKYTTRK